VIRSLNTAAVAMQQEQVRIDALANNLANVSATGFRQIITRLAEPVSGTAPGGRPTAADLMTNAAARQAAGGTGGAGGATRGTGGSLWQPVTRADLSHALDPRPGPVQPSGRDADVAIMGRGYFEVETPEGPRYTRNGSFVLNADRELSTPDGRRVAGDGGPLRIEGKDFSIASDGTVTVDGAQVGRLKLVDFADPSKLEHVGNSLLRAPADLAPQPVPAEETVVAQGHVEGSNVNPIDTLVAMIEAQRAFETQSKVLQTENELLGKSVNNLPRTNG
jgi:flagellar basal-body rod protein FlgF